MKLRLLLLMAVCLMHLPPAGAQSLSPATSDSILADFAATGAVMVLAPYITDAIHGERRVWTIVMPVSSARWNNVRAHLRRVLQARDSTSADTSRITLEVTMPTVGETYATGSINLRFYRLCSGTWVYRGGEDIEFSAPKNDSSIRTPVLGGRMIRDVFSDARCADRRRLQ